jgi:hypothetical protein
MGGRPGEAARFVLCERKVHGACQPVRKWRGSSQQLAPPRTTPGKIFGACLSTTEELYFLQPARSKRGQNCTPLFYPIDQQGLQENHAAAGRELRVRPDPAYAKYPPKPVIRCDGYRKKDQTEGVEER